MNIVAVNGSPTGGRGSTGRLLDAVMSGARDAGADVKLFELGGLNIEPCTACRNCQRVGTCTLDDDYPRIKAAMIAADGIVLASPNYISTVSAQMKALLDRSFSMLHCQILHGKYGACVIASGSPLYARLEEYLQEVLTSSGCWHVGTVAAAGGVLDDPVQARDILAQARALGEKLVDAIAKKQQFSDQEENLKQSFEIMRWLVKEHRDSWPYEYEYWRVHWDST